MLGGGVFQIQGDSYVGFSNSRPMWGKPKSVGFLHQFCWMIYPGWHRRLEYLKSINTTNIYIYMQLKLLAENFMLFLNVWSQNLTHNP